MRCWRARKACRRQASAPPRCRPRAEAGLKEMTMSKLNLSRLTGLGLALGMALALGTAALPARAQEEALPERLSWSFWGPFGHYDRAQVQRGFKVYREVCAACHSLH